MSHLGSHLSRLVDSHAHLDASAFDEDRAEVVARALEAGVGAILTAGTDLESSRQAVALAEAYPGVFAAVGVHPHDAASATEETFVQLRQLCNHPKVLAVGEIGLDFYRDLSPRDVQRRVFEGQLALAAEVGKPVIVHQRESLPDVMACLERWGEEWGTESDRPAGVLHCFSGDVQAAERVIAQGFYVSLAGPVTYLNARRPVEVARAVPLDRLLLETDCPYLSPHPLRGKRNEPANVRLVAQRIAEIKALPLEEVAGATTANAQRLFAGLTLVSIAECGSRSNRLGIAE